MRPKHTAHLKYNVFYKKEKKMEEKKKIKLLK